LVNPGLAFLGLNRAPARVDLQQPTVFVVVVHALGHEAVVLGKDLRCNQREGRPVHGHPQRDTHSRTRTVDIYLQDTAQQITAIAHPRAHAEVLAEHRLKPP